MTDESSPGSSRPSGEQDSQPRRFRYDHPDESIGVSIAHAVATVCDVDPLSLEPRLYDVVDPDALETLLASGTGDSDVRISFAFGSCAVTVTQNGEILVGEMAK
ncbi:HalOD1 output domain-containing protein [Halohasta salina]|uniref:HalOD1 output domain-containing protein n=1 Tax=Halohasta salina TaxID=2961621 RepID=UPI0020A2EAAF|nr:HalOD1 output domain-containing protein [Halohasta salina]